MSLPVEPDFYLIKFGDGTTPTEVFTIACGVQDVNINATANTNDRFVRDCATPGAIPYRKVRVSGKQMDITGSGMIDKAQLTVFNTALGKAKNYKTEAYIEDGTDTGVLMGTWAGSYVLTSFGQSSSRDSQASVEINLASNGAWTWTPAA